MELTRSLFALDSLSVAILSSLAFIYDGLCCSNLTCNNNTCLNLSISDGKNGNSERLVSKYISGRVTAVT